MSQASFENEERLHEFRPTYAAWFWVIVLTSGFGFIWAWWQRRAIRYVITNKRVIKHTGRVSSKTDEFRIADVSRIRTKQGLGDKVLGGGTIKLDTGPDEIEIVGVPNYEAVVRSIRAEQTDH